KWVKRPPGSLRAASSPIQAEKSLGQRRTDAGASHLSRGALAASQEASFQLLNLTDCHSGLLSFKIIVASVAHLRRFNPKRKENQCPTSALPCSRELQASR